MRLIDADAAFAKIDDYAQFLYAESIVAVDPRDKTHFSAAYSAVKRVQEIINDATTVDAKRKEDEP